MSKRRYHKNERSVRVRKHLKLLFGWSIADWARRHGFRPEDVYAALKDNGRRVGRRRVLAIRRALLEDLQGRRCLHASALSPSKPSS